MDGYREGDRVEVTLTGDGPVLGYFCGQTDKNWLRIHRFRDEKCRHAAAYPQENVMSVAPLVEKAALMGAYFLGKAEAPKGHAVLSCEDPT